MKKIVLVYGWFVLVAMLGCGSSDDDPIKEINLLSVSLNGGSFDSGAENIPIDAELSFVFSSAVDPASFESQLSLTGNGTYTLSYANGSTKAIVKMDLEYETEYTLILRNGPIGRDGESLKSALSYLFTTAEDDIIHSLAPCTSTSACLRSVELMGSEGSGTFEFYSNYPIYEENAEWEDLRHAIIVVYGAGHNPDDYYGWMTTTLESEMMSSSTILIAPFFRNTSTGSSEDFYWASTNWRTGQESTNSNKISSFTAIDKLVDQLSQKDHFPVLESIIITGHSSGAAFTHVYGGANTSESNHSDIAFEYIVANSQFFYYPDGQRINESTNQLYTPTGCSGYTIWPLGYNVTPSYLSTVNSTTFNEQFTSRSLIYLLGNGNQPDPTLNTTDCENTLQGSTRYKRGENMFQYMELEYVGIHNHSRTIVEGIGHDGQGMYQSAEFKSLLSQLLN